MADTYNIADYFPSPASGEILNKAIYFETSGPLVEIWQFRNAMDTEGIAGTRIDNYTPAGSGWNHLDAWWIRETDNGLREFMDFFPSSGFLTYQDGKEINWGAPGIIDATLPNISSSATYANGSLWGWFTVYLSEICATHETPFGVFNDILLVTWTQIVSGASISGAYYMAKGRGPIEIHYQNSPPRYALDLW